MTASVDSPSILGEAVHVGFCRLRALLHEEFGHPVHLIGARVAHTLGFSTWDDLCDCAMSTTSRNIDARLECLVEGHLPHDDLADRLAAAVGTDVGRMHAVLVEFRDPARSPAPCFV